MFVGSSPDPESLGTECRPALPGGLALGASCGAEGSVCRTGLCLGPLDYCSALCESSASCGPGFACIRTPFVTAGGVEVEVGLCLTACPGDAACAQDASGRVCQYGLAVGAEGIIGYCDAPRPGGAVGEACDLAARPPRTCDHGYCRGDALGRYCTQGCVADGDCPPDWTCTATPFDTEAGPFSVGICRRPI
jgi:hypothetical protein